VFDLGYLGVERDFPGQKSSIPNRKRRNQKELAKEEKEHNPNHSRKIMVIEHTICRMKKYRIIIERCSQKQAEKVQQGIGYSIRTGKLQSIVIFLEEISHCHADRAYCF
jgi:hypothetical protein